MKRLYVLLLVLAVVFSLASCVNVTIDHQTPATVKQAIEDVNAKFAEAFKRGDAVAVAGFYTEDAKLLPPNSPMVSGRQEIQEFWKGFIEMTASREVTLDTLDVEYNGSLAYEIGAYALKIQLKGSQTQAIVLEPTVETGKYVVVWKRQTDDSWKIAVDTWNSNSPLPAR